MATKKAATKVAKKKLPKKPSKAADTPVSKAADIPDLDKLVLTREVRRAVSAKLEMGGLAIYRNQDRQIRFMAKLKEALERTRDLGVQPRDPPDPALKVVQQNLTALKRSLGKLTPFQRAAIDLRAEYERARERFGTKESQRSPTMLHRVGVNQWLTDYFLDQFELDCTLLRKAARANEVLPNYVGPPLEIRLLISRLARAWREVFGQEPKPKDSGAFGSTINILLTALGFNFEVGTRALRSILNS